MNKMLLFEDYIPLLDRVEQQFSAPFPVVNAAFYHMLTLCTARKGLVPAREETAGAARYCVRFATHEAVFIYLLQRGDNLTTISIHPVVRRDGPQTVKPETLGEIGELLSRCCEAVIQAIRYTNPDFTLQPHEMAPPMPSWNDDTEAALRWKLIYARDMKDDEHAVLLGVDYQTYRNAKSKFGYTKGTLRGKPKK